MDIQFWIWLAIIVITFIARAAKKKDQSIPKDYEGEDQRPTRPDLNPKPLTFEELLKEIQASKTPAPQPVVVRKPEYVDYDDDLKEEEKDLETSDYNYRNDDSIYETYEKAKREAFEKPSLEETVKLQDTVVKYEQFKGYQQVEQKNVASEIWSEFHDPEGFKKAFIMSEILKRRF
jgi:hypothetical protein